MTEKVKKYLFDIKKAIKSIDKYLNDERDFESFKNQKIVRRAVEREFEIIGEAVNKLMKIDEAPAIQNARRIVDLRNFIIHAYDQVDPEILWSIILKKFTSARERS
jgi:uncharacterized protein with HEPN domain